MSKLLTRMPLKTDKSSGRASACTVVATFALALAGCSADVTRFSGPGFSLNGNDDSANLIPPGALTGSSGGRLSDQTPSVGYGTGTTPPMETSALPDRTPPSSYTDRTPTESAPVRTADRSYEAPRSSYGSSAATSPGAPGQTITVERGDTLYGLSRRHGVSVAELMSANNLDDSLLRIGQTLTVPGSTGTNSRPYETAAAPAERPPVSLAVQAPADIPSTWQGSYEVRSGDSLYKIARQYGVRTSDLQRYNSITDPRRVMPGTRLRVPGGSIAPPSETVAQSSGAPGGSQSPSLINSGQQYAALSDGRTSDAAPASKGVRTVTIAPSQISPAAGPSAEESSSGKLRWPVRGKLLAGFGARPDGTHNDGVNLSVPLGTDVHAADEGVVAYAGSELRSYGNLILVRHDNGWVTAYAHNDKLLVSRGDKVKRGQVIAKSGKSGQVSEPQVHFELRQSSKQPVDPVPYLEKL